MKERLSRFDAVDAVVLSFIFAWIVSQAIQNVITLEPGFARDMNQYIFGGLVGSALSNLARNIANRNKLHTGPK